MNILDKFEINSTNEFHILRHFEFVDDAYKKTLINKPYWYYDYSQKKYVSSYISQNDIECALETIGTKFYKNIFGIENPKKLLELIKEKFSGLVSRNEVGWNIENEKKVCAFSFEYDATVGKMNCLAINKLTEDEKKKVKVVARSKCAGENNIVVNIISGADVVDTSMIYVEIVEIEQLPFFVITAFPDCSANSISSDDDVVFVV